jgi:hypothetical protein
LEEAAKSVEEGGPCGASSLFGPLAPAAHVSRGGKECARSRRRADNGQISSREPSMIVRVDIDTVESTSFDYRVSHQGEALYGDGDFSTAVAALVAAFEGLAPDVVALEVAYRGIVSGTYPLIVVARKPDQIANHALMTTTTVEALMAAA